jgi:hypothetical protein
MNRTNGEISGIFVPMLLLLAVSILTLGAVLGAPAKADTFDNREKIYLKDITPILYELSEVGKSVSANAVSLVHGSPDRCSYEFGYYQGIVESLKTRLTTIPPPPRMGEVHTTALQAIGDYSNGLDQYAAACIETDSNIKSEYAERAWQNLVSADNKIRQVNSLITSPSVAAAPAPAAVKETSAQKIQRMCTTSWPADERMQEYCVKNQTESLATLNQMLQQYPAGSPERKIIQSCSAVWKKGEIYDYRMTVFCVNNQLGAN